MSEFCPIIKKGGAFDAFAKKYHISEGELKASIRKVGINNPALQEASEDELLNSTEFRELASNHYGINPSGWITSNKEYFEDVNAEFSDFKRTLSDNVQWIDDNTIYFKRDEINQDDIDDIEYIKGIIGHENVFNRETYDGVVISFSLPRYVKKDSLANIDWARTAQNGYEVSSSGDNRFSASYARFNKDTIIDVVDVGGMTIEDVYQYVIKKSGKGKAPAMDSILNHKHVLRKEDYEFLHTLPDDLGSAIINDSTGEKPATKEQLEDYYYYRGYLPLWQEWAKQNPELIEELRVKSAGKTLTDQFADTRVSQARALADILNTTNIGQKELQSILEKQEKPATEEKQLKNKSSVSFYEGDIEPSNNTIFVFGSNPEGRHGAGAAKIAREKFGAIYGQGEGLQGNAYALPTKDLRVKENNSLRSIPPEQIIESIKKLYETARQNPDKQFKVAYRNTDRASLNGYTGLEMIDMFLNAGPIPVNIVFSKEWVDTGKFNISREWFKDREDEWKEATDLLHKIKDTLGKRVRKSDNFKKDHTYYILNPQTGTWEKTQTSVSAIAENVYKRGVWGRSEDDMSFDINQPDENNPAIRLGKDFDKFARDYFSKKGVKQENFPNYSKEEFNALKRDFKAFTDMLDERFGKDNWRINSSPITVGGVVKRGKNNVTVGGELDLLLYTKDKRFYVIDMKTWNANNKDSYWNQAALGYARQQSLYIALMQQNLAELDPNNPSMSGVIDGAFLLRATQNYPQYSANKERYTIDKDGKIFIKNVRGEDIPLVNSSEYSAARLVLANQDDGSYFINIDDIDGSKEMIDSFLKDMDTESAKEFLEGATQEDIAAALNRIKELKKQTILGDDKRSIGLSTIFDSEIGILPSKVTRVANKMAKLFSFYLNLLQNDPAAKTKGYLKNQYSDDIDFSKMSRKDILMIPRFASDLMYTSVRQHLENARVMLSDPGLIAEMDLFLANYDTMVELASKQLIKNEHMYITVDGKLMEEEESTEDVEGNDSQDDGSPEANESGEVEMIYGETKLHQSAIKAVSLDIKTILSTIRESTDDGQYFVDEYGLWDFMDYSTVASSILKWTQGTTSKSEFLAALREHAKSTPWLRDVLAMVDVYAPNIIPTKITYERSSSLYRNFAKSELPFYSSRLVRGNDGNLVMKTIMENTGKAANNALTRLMADYKNADAPIFKNGKINIFDVSSIINDINPKLYTSAQGKLMSKQSHRENQWNDIDSIIDYDDDYIPYFVDQNNPIAQLCRAIEKLGITIDKQRFASLFSGDHLKDNYDDTTFAKVAQLTYKIARTISNSVKDAEDAGAIYKPLDPSDENNVIYLMRNLLEKVYQNSDESVDPSCYVNGKMYYSYQYPTTMQKLLAKLSNKVGKTNAEYLDWMNDEFGRSIWFYIPGDTDFDEGHWNLKWLERLANDPSSRDALQFMVKVASNNIGYADMGDQSYKLSILSDYFFDNNGEFAIYRTPIASDKSTYEAVKFLRIKDKDQYTQELIEQAHDIFMQELMRAKSVFDYHFRGEKNGHIDKFDIKLKGNNAKMDAIVMDKYGHGIDIKTSDVMNNGKYIYNGTGASFHMIPAVVHMMQTDTDFAQKVVDVIFNDRKLDDSLSNMFEEKFMEHMKEAVEHEKQSFADSGVFEQEPYQVYDEYEDRVVWTKRYKYVDWIIRQLNGGKEVLGAKADELLDAAIEEFVYNNMLAQWNIVEITTTDMAFYGTIENFSKRNAQQHASGMPFDAEAVVFVDGNPIRVSDGKIRNTVIADNIISSHSADQIKIALEMLAERTTDPVAKANIKASIPMISSQYRKTNTADGQAYVSLTGLRKQMVMAGTWDMNVHEPIYQRFINGTPTDDDLMFVFNNPQKPFGTSNIWRNRGGDTMPDVRVPMQFKNSEVLLAFAGALEANVGLDSQLAALYRFMEDSHYTGRVVHVGRVVNPGTYRQDGIDSIQFESCVKVGLNNKSDVNNLSPIDTYNALRKAVYNSDGTYNRDNINEYSIEGYVTQQEVPFHFYNHKIQIGSQMAVIAVNDVSDTAMLDDPGSGKQITGKEMKTRYNNAFAELISNAANKMLGELGMTRKNTSSRDIALNKSLSRMMQQNVMSGTKYSIDMLRAVSLHGGSMSVSPENEMLSDAVQSMLGSSFRKAIYKIFFNGGQTVQMSNWGRSTDLDLRFKDKSGGLLMKYNDFCKENNLDAYNGNEPNKDAIEAYKQYVRENQAGFAYVETMQSIPNSNVMAYLTHVDPDNGGKRVFYKYPAGHPKAGQPCLNVQDLAELFDVHIPEKLLKCIYYRIPTQLKSFIMPCMITEFTLPGSGDTSAYPLILTVINDSDFDIDKGNMLFYDARVSTIGGKTTLVDDYSIEKYNKADGSKNREAALRNEMLDMQWAAMTGDDALRQQFRPGNFDIMDQTSYELELYRFGLPREDVEQMTPEQRVAKYEELSYDPRWSDISLMSTAARLKKACMNAKKLIAMSAVQEIAHDVFSMMTGPGRFRIAQNDIRPLNIAGLDIGESGSAYLDETVDSEGTLQSINLGMLVGAAADGVKKPVLARTNIGMYTNKIYTLLLRYGATPRQAMLFVTQPIMREVTEAYDNASNNGFADVQRIIRNLEQTINPKGGLYNTYNSKTNKDVQTLMLDEYDLVSRLIDDKNFDTASYIDNENSPMLQVDMRILAALRELDKAVNSLEGLNQFSRFTSIVNGESQSLAKSIEKESRREKFLIDQAGTKPAFNVVKLDEQNNPTNVKTLEISDIKSQIPFIGARIESQEALHDALLEVQSSYNSDAFRIAAKIVANLCGRDYANETINRSVHKAMAIYKMINGTDIKTYGTSIPSHIYGVFNPNTRSQKEFDENVDFYYKNFAGYYNEMITKHMDELYGNKFIESIIQMDADKYMPVPYLKTSLNNLDEDGRQAIMDDWSALVRSDNEEIQMLGVQLGIYFALRSNMRYSPSTPYHLMPVDVIKSIPNLDRLDRMEAVRNPQIDLNEFLGLYILNNTNQPGLVPSVDLQYLSQGDPTFGVAVIDFNASNKDLSDGKSGYNPISNIGRFYIRPFSETEGSDRMAKLSKAIGLNVRKDSITVSRPIVKSGNNIIMLTNRDLAFNVNGFEIGEDMEVMFRTLTPKGVRNGIAEYFGDILDDGVYGDFVAEENPEIEENPNNIITDEQEFTPSGLSFIPSFAMGSIEQHSPAMEGTTELSLSALGISQGSLSEDFVRQRVANGLNINMSDTELLKKFGFNTDDATITSEGRKKVADLLREELDKLNLC